LGEDFSDVAADRRKRDEGFEEPLTKKRGWFTRKPTTPMDNQADFQERESDRKADRSNDRTAERRQTASSHNQRDDDRDDALPDFKEITPQRSSWWKRSPKAEKPPKKKERTAADKDGEAKSTQRGRWFQKSTKPKADADSNSGQPKVKKPWGLLKKRKPIDEPTDASASKASKTNSDKPWRKLFGFFDKLKLKPPSDGSGQTAPVPVTASRTPVPSSSAAQRHETSRVDSSYNEPRQSSNTEEDDFEDDGHRSLSKAERKRLRRQQQENRRAA
jgi:hypothetical protein